MLQRIASPARFTACAAALGFATAAPAAVIPVTGGGAHGHFPFEYAFDAQPLTDPVDGQAVASDGGEGVAFYNDPPAQGGGSRAAYVDFGENYADLSIEAAWYLYRQYGRVANSGTLNTWWSPDIDGEFDAGDGDVAAPDFGIVHPDQPKANPDGQHVWYRTPWDGGPVTPAARYLILQTEEDPDGTLTYTNGIEEIAFTGVIPEPASLALMGLGAMLAFRRPQG